MGLRIRGADIGNRDGKAFVFFKERVYKNNDSSWNLLRREVNGGALFFGENPCKN